MISYLKIYHARKVEHVLFHPLVENVLLTASADLIVKLWDVKKGAEKGAEKQEIKGIQNPVTLLERGIGFLPKRVSAKSCGHIKLALQASCLFCLWCQGR